MSEVPLYSHGGLRSFHSKSTSLHAMDSRASCGEKLHMPPPEFGGYETLVVHRVDGARLVGEANVHGSSK
jgi:hypothetical protein